jgi:NADH dehydrogenase FAD-containing subunit
VCVQTGRQGSGYYALNLNDDGTPKKQKIAVIGSGWGAHSFVKNLDATKYDVTLVSPRNYFLFTPMLAGAATGTVEMRSITESIREANPDVNYLEATVTQVQPEEKKIACQTVVCEGAECSINDFELEYDTLVYAAGAGVNTFGIKGVKEHCFFLKQVGDAHTVFLEMHTQCSLTVSS